MSSEPRTPTPRVQSPRGLEAAFFPRSLAVVGASTRSGAVGHRILKNILDGGYKGKVFAVHPTAKQVLGVPAYPTPEALPEPVDLVVVAAPAPAVVEIAESCARRGVKALVVITAGFRETGPEGAALEKALQEVLDRTGMRLIGPNCLGIMNLDPAVRLNATFGASPGAPGKAALMTQSGALGVAILERAAETGVGLARFASMGNKMDVSGNDLLMLWQYDHGVDLVLMYLENFGNPRNFARVARDVSRRKPMILVKSGRSPEGARAAASHTGAMMDPDRAVDAMLEQCGVLRVATVESLLDVALAAALQPLPSGDRVAIVTNSGGPAIMATDALGPNGLRLAKPGAATMAALTRILPAGVPAANPLDLIAGATPEGYGNAVETLLRDPEVDMVLVIQTTVFGNDLDIVRAVEAAVRKAPGKPVTYTAFGARSTQPHVQDLVAHGIPAYTFPENAVAALGALRRLRLLRDRPEGRTPEFAVDRAAVEAILRDPGRDDGWLRQDRALQLLAAYGIPTVPCAFVQDADAAAREAPGDGPWVLKGEAPGLVHKSEAGAVRLGLATREAVKAAYAEMEENLRRHGHAMSGAVVMAQAAPGPREILLGATQHERYGPLVAVGLGGVYAEAFQDTAFRLAPLTDLEAGAMVRSLRGRRLLEGFRGDPPRDLEALEDALERLGRLAWDLPEVVELDANPFFLYTHGGVAVDARVRLRR